MEKWEEAKERFRKSIDWSADPKLGLNAMYYKGGYEAGEAAAAARLAPVIEAAQRAVLQWSRNNLEDDAPTPELCLAMDALAQRLTDGPPELVERLPR